MALKLTPVARTPEPTYPTFGSRIARGLAVAAAAAVTLLCQPASAEEQLRMPGEAVAVTPPSVKPPPPPNYQAPIVVTPTPVKPPVDARLPGRIAPVVPTR